MADRRGAAPSLGHYWKYKTRETSISGFLSNDINGSNSSLLASLNKFLASLSHLTRYISLTKKGEKKRLFTRWSLFLQIQLETRSRAVALSACVGTYLGVHYKSIDAFLVEIGKTDICISLLSH